MDLKRSTHQAKEPASGAGGGAVGAWLRSFQGFQHLSPDGAFEDIEDEDRCPMQIRSLNTFFGSGPECLDLTRYSLVNHAEAETGVLG